MDGLSQIIGAMQPSAPAPLWQQLLTGGMFGAGELSNLLQAHKQQQWQDYVMNLAKNPSQVSQMVTSATQPLDNALVQAVNNRVQGDMAQRGLSQAPGIFAGTEAQALAPFVQQNQQNAREQVLQMLGLPATATTLNRPGQDMTSALQMFLRSFGTGGGRSNTAGSWVPLITRTAPTVPPQGITGDIPYLPDPITGAMPSSGG